MARKTVERNISYDDIRKIYYVSMDLGKDKEGKRVKRYQTYRTLYAARMGLRNFLTHREEELRTPKHDLALADWLDSYVPAYAVFFSLLLAAFLIVHCLYRRRESSPKG